MDHNFPVHSDEYSRFMQCHCSAKHTVRYCTYNIPTCEAIVSTASLSNRGARLQSLWQTPTRYCAEQKKRGG